MNTTDDDFSNYSNNSPKSRKQTLIEKCGQLDISIYVDDKAENSNEPYAMLRPVASEADLDSRINSKEAVTCATKANRLSVIALLIALVAIIVTLAGQQ